MYTPDFLKPKILSVSQLNFYIKSLIENDPRMNVIFLSGEISNLTDHYRSGHIYLSLKDEKSVIRAVMFAGNARNLKFRPLDGMKVLCRGRVAVYEPSGQYQLYIEDMQPDGIGALNLAYEQLKSKLDKEGLFSSDIKKDLPRFPRTVGVITSPTGAAVQDIRNILFRRYPCVNVVMCPVLVQGDNAVPQLINALNQLDKYKLCDVIIIGRGGGSIEDLWAFNSEELARAIYKCSIPVISAVGHETDFTICDFVSDMRAPTPSAAAELAVPDTTDLLSYYSKQKQYIDSMIEYKLRAYDKTLSDFKRRTLVASPEHKLNQLQNIILISAEKLKASVSEAYNKNLLNIKSIASKLEELNPIAVLSRGYSIAEKDGKAVNSVTQIKQGDMLTLTFSDGKINSIVTGD